MENSQGGKETVITISCTIDLRWELLYVDVTAQCRQVCSIHEDQQHAFVT